MEHRGVVRHLIQSALDAASKDKPVEIQLAWYLNDYKVLGITNTTVLKPGEWLAVEAVDQLNATKGWTTKMADNAVIGTLFGLGASAVENVAKV